MQGAGEPPLSPAALETGPSLSGACLACAIFVTARWTPTQPPLIPDTLPTTLRDM